MRISVPVTRLATATALAAAIAAPAIVAAPASAAKKQTITMSGSTSVYPLANALQSKYKALNSKVDFRVAQGGSDKGVTDVAKGAVTIGNSSRDPRSSDPKGLVFNRIARDAVCIITNPANRLANGLNQQQVADIFSGKIRSWADVPAPRRPARSASRRATRPRVRSTPSRTSSWAARRSPRRPRGSAATA